MGMGEIHVWNWRIEWREDVQEPIVGGLYERRPAPDRPFDATTESALLRYLAFSAKRDEEIIVAVESLIISREPIIVWGVGTLARRLLACTRFGELNIVAFVDSNPHVQGISLAGKSVLNPTQIASRNETILVCSISFAAEIATAIRCQYRLRNRILSLLGRALQEGELAI